MNHPLLDILKNQKKGIPSGICSVCSANEYVLEAAIERAKVGNKNVLIEATANQVNQFGGYTGMKPNDFRDFVYTIADKVKFPKEQIILGGDHLGPLTWKNENESEAMDKAKELIRQYVLAGFTKIHLDTSMHLLDDCKDAPLDPKIIAQRGAMLCAAAEEAFLKLKAQNSGALPPVYVVGSEVPVPGGSEENEELVQVTKPYDFVETVNVFCQEFKNFNLESAWKRVIAVVVQPGVEFSDDAVHEYKRNEAKELCHALSGYDNLVFEGHSTDYQTAALLKQMVEDGIAILKVGPALTFALREGLFMLSYIEHELLKGKAGVELSGFIETLDKVMVEKPGNWEKYYHGDELQKRFSRKYSMSDRCRYYLPDPKVNESIEKLLSNLESADIPLTLISQFMPVQYAKIREGKLNKNAKALLKDKVVNVLDDYYFATMM